MKKIYYVRTNGYDMVVSVDNCGDCRYMTENQYFPSLSEEPEVMHEQILDFLKSIEDDSSWSDDCDYDQVFVDEVDILAEIESEI